MILFLIGGGLFIFTIYQTTRDFKIEEEIHKTFSPLLDAINNYADINKDPPSTLDKLLPKFITRIPTSKIIENVEYKLINNGKDWELKLQGENNIYIYRFTNIYSAEEKKQIIKQYHGNWAVFEFKKQ